MSVQAMTWARGKAPTLTAQAVLFALADFAYTNGITYVGQERLAWSCSCSQRAVRQNLARLEREGLIKRVRRSDRRGYRTSDWTVLGPLAVDRGEMQAVTADDVEQGRYPEAIAELALECDDREWAAQMLGLPAYGAGRQQGSTPPHGTVLPADTATPTGTSRHPYRQITPSLPAPGAGEQLGEPNLTQPTQEAEPSALPSEARRGARAALEQAFARWAELVRPGSNVTLTGKRAKAYFSRRSRDSFTDDELLRVIDAANDALELEALDYAHRETEFYRLFMDREHVEAWHRYQLTGDPCVLSEMLETEAPRERGGVGGRGTRG